MADAPAFKNNRRGISKGKGKLKNTSTAETVDSLGSLEATIDAAAGPSSTETSTGRSRKRPQKVTSPQDVADAPACKNNRRGISKGKRKAPKLKRTLENICLICQDLYIEGNIISEIYEKVVHTYAIILN